MSKVSKAEDSEGNHQGYIHYCPGCDMHHCFDSRWTFNGDFDKPTFSPSMLVRYPWGPDKEQRHCHYFMRDGKIQYLSDCTHELAGKTIECPEDI